MVLKCMQVLAVVGLMATQVNCAQTTLLNTQKEKVSYGIGVNIAKSFKPQGIEIDVEALVKGLRDAFSGGKLLMTEDEIQATMRQFQIELNQKQAQGAKAVSTENKKEGAAFLAGNKTKPGVVTLPSGLQYKILKAGNGKKPIGSDTVECHYRGTLVNGTEFDSSYRRGQPASFPVSGVIPGWTEALKLMPVGSKWQLFIPPQLAYGTQGAGRDIGPDATLIFEVELLAIK
ncbi:MAG: FKBP-type peptidyl-prolyl cis-trans isomerase [Candidatus Omnitrophota bacterium]